MIFSEVYLTYLPLMYVSSGWIFLTSFIVTYNFSSMQKSHDEDWIGIRLLRWYCSPYMVLPAAPHTGDENRTLEKIDLIIFEKPTATIVKQNVENRKETIKD